MSASQDILKIIMVRPEGISLAEFKKVCSPIALAISLKNMESIGIITIDWKKRSVSMVNTQNLILSLYQNKDVLRRKKTTIPTFMLKEKIEINKPFINKSKGETD